MHPSDSRGPTSATEGEKPASESTIDESVTEKSVPTGPASGTPDAPDATDTAGAPADPPAEDLAPNPPVALAEPPAYSVPAAPVALARQRRGGLVLALALAIVAVLAGGALFASGYALGQRQLTQPGTPPGEDSAFQPFWDAYHAVIDRYAGGTVDQKKLIQGSIKGLFEAVGDPYSQYLTPDEYKATLQSINGEFEGIGADIGTKTSSGTASDCSTLGADCKLVIISPIDGSPALKAGIKAGDIVTKVDGSSLDGLTVDQATAKIRGARGTPVTLTIVRGTAAPFDIKITRDVIVQKEVVTKDLADGTVGYIKVAGFSDQAAKDVAAALAADVKKGQSQLILDLRGNPGGYVTAARSIASQFIGSGTIFWEEDSKGNQTPTPAEPGGAATDPKLKVVVLIDKGSASASEIVAGALQDTKRATLVGEQSFGKGTVQQWTDLGNDNGGFKLTVAKWLTPNKTWINHKGLTPDVPVTVPATVPAGQDPILDKGLQILAATASLEEARLIAA